MQDWAPIAIGIGHSPHVIERAEQLFSFRFALCIWLPTHKHIPVSTVKIESSFANELIVAGQHYFGLICGFPVLFLT